MKEYKKQYRRDNKEEINKYKKQWRKDNPERIQQYLMNNKEKIRERERKYEKNRLKTNLKYNLRCRMLHAVGKALKGNKKGRHWEALLGYTLNDLIKRLKKTMPEGYCWNDYLSGKLHVDHKIPISVYNFTKPEHIDFKRCWALDNLQLLPARKNRIKHDKLNKPFQPALQIC